MSNAKAMGANAEESRQWKVHRRERSFGLPRRLPRPRVFFCSTFHPLLCPPLILPSAKLEPWGFEPQIPPCHGGVIPFHYGPGCSAFTLAESHGQSRSESTRSRLGSGATQPPNGRADRHRANGFVYNISSGRGCFGGGKARSSLARSSGVSRMRSEPWFSRTCSGLPALGMTITPS